jgi:hypothetical protein
VAFGFKSFLKGIRLVPVSTTAITQNGDIEVLSANGKLNYFNSTASPVVTEAHAATLTNKVMSGASNTFSNIGYSSLTLTNSIVNADINASAAIAYSKLNLVSSIVNADISASAAITRSKLASGTAYRLLANDVSGVMSENAALTAAHVIFADANGQLSGEQFLSKARGGSAQDNSSITFPASGVLTTNDGVQTLSNKSFSDPITLAEVATPSTPASGNGKIYFKSDGFLYQLNDDGTETKVGAGSGGINYIINSDAESNTAGWATYADAAGSAPVDGTGGSANITLTRSTSSPLRGTGSFLITKDAANRQGQGVSYDFTIADADKAKPLAISFNYTISSGTFVAGDSSDIRVYLYDVTNAQVIQPAPYTIQGGAGSNHRFLGTFQTASNSNSYRLILHIATTSASAYDFKLDDVSVGPQMLNYGSPVTDWTAYTPTTQGFGTISSVQMFYRRVGDSIEIQGKFVSGTPTSSEARVGLPSGLTAADTSKISSIRVCGHTATSETNQTQSVLIEPSVTYVTFGREFWNNGFSPLTKANGDAFVVNGDSFSLFASVPILGWSSTVEMSNDTDTRVVAAQYTVNSSQAIPPSTVTQLNFGTQIYSTHSMFSGTSPLGFVAPVSGYYKIYINLRWDANVTGTVQMDTLLNGVTSQILFDNNGTEPGTRHTTGAGTRKLNAGDVLVFRIVHSTGVVRNIENSTSNYITIERISGPSAIAASETVAARYTTSAGQSIPTTSMTVVDFGTKDYDTHGAVSGTGSSWVFTCPMSGYYQVSTKTRIGSGITFTNNKQISISLRKNGSEQQRLMDEFTQEGNTYGIGWQGTGVVKCLAGDTLAIALYHEGNSSANLGTTANENWVAINLLK